MTFRTPRLALSLLSAAALIFEINLTRLFSVAQFYHFAFMIVSLALLGSGAAGTFLAIFPALAQTDPRLALRRLALAGGLSILGAYLLTNHLPFDSFSIAWDLRQAAILALHYLALALPFFFCGLAAGLLLAANPGQAGPTYAANLAGAAAGSAAALVIAPFAGAEGAVLFAAGLSGLAGLVVCANLRSSLAPAALTVLMLLMLGWRWSNGMYPGWLALQISPYKSLAYALQYPGAELVSQRWNGYSRLDIVRSAGIRSLPGLSYRYAQTPPVQDGLLVDAGELCPLVRPGFDPAVFDYLPLAAAFRLRPGARTLVLEPCGGLDILSSLELGAGQVLAVEPNPLLVEASEKIYFDPRVTLVSDSGRSYTRRPSEPFDVVVLSLTAGYHPVRSGAYSLAEDYRYTVEALGDAYARLGEDGLLVITRWLQNPPSEELRAFALAVAALDQAGANPRQQIVAFRGYNTATFLVRKGAFNSGELAAIRRFAAERAYDIVYAPGLKPEETNRFNRLPEPVYEQLFNELLRAEPRQTFYDAYPYEISPPTDDRPFFGHFFKWSQAGQVWEEMGKTWQPFGGAGYFVLLALLLLATLMAGVLILLPVAVRRWLSHTSEEPASTGRSRPALASVLAYFGLIGLAFLLVEIPLLQRFILYLGRPAYALAAILFTLLLFSGLGSRFGQRIPLAAALTALVIILFSAPIWLPALFDYTLGWAAVARLALTTLCLAPVGFLMGLPFPAGIRLIASTEPPATQDISTASTSLVAWAWATNGAASVIASVLAALLALTFGFNFVLRLGAICYSAAWLAAWLYSRAVRLKG